MNERSNLIDKLQSDFNTRAAYIQAKVGTLVPSQIRALRLKSDMPRQSDLADAAEMHQSRISMFETPGSNPTLNTLGSIAAALKVGLKVEFVPFSEMLAWENGFSQDQFDVVKIDNDQAFLNPMQVHPLEAPVTVNLESLAAMQASLGDIGDISGSPVRGIFLKTTQSPSGSFAIPGGQTDLIRANYDQPINVTLTGDWLRNFTSEVPAASIELLAAAQKSQETRTDA